MDAVSAGICEDAIIMTALSAKGAGADFSRAMLAATFAHEDGEQDLVRTFLASAAIYARTDAEMNRLADFVKVHRY